MLKQTSAVLLALGITALPVRADAPSKVFVASTGSDANDGSRASPKRSFQAAHDAVAAKGEIVALDTAGYGAVTITKSVAVVVPPGVAGFVTVNGASNAISIQAGGTDVISIRGLILEGGAANSGGAGILANSFGTLDVQDTTIRNFYNGLNMAPSGDAHLLFRGGTIRDVQYGLVAQTYTASIDAVVTDLSINNAAQAGIYVFAGGNGPAAKVTTKRCVVTNTKYAIETVTNTSTIVVDDCTLSGNAYPLFKQDGAGTILSRGNNTVYNNANAGAATTPLAPQ